MSDYTPATKSYFDSQGLSQVLNSKKLPNEALALALASKRKEGQDLPGEIMNVWANVLSDLRQQARHIEIDFIRHARRLGWSWDQISEALELDGPTTAEQRTLVLQQDLHTAQQLKAAKSK